MSRIHRFGRSFAVASAALLLIAGASFASTSVFEQRVDTATPANPAVDDSLEGDTDEQLEDVDDGEQADEDDQGEDSDDGDVEDSDDEASDADEDDGSNEHQARPAEPTGVSHEAKSHDSHDGDQGADSDEDDDDDDEDEDHDDDDDDDSDDDDDDSDDDD